jgi:hypothetical protein
MAMLNLNKQNQLCSLHLFCRELVCAFRREKIDRLIAASGASFHSGKTNGVVPANVM